jgi:hypothetical protein
MKTLTLFMATLIALAACNKTEQTTPVPPPTPDIGGGSALYTPRLRFSPPDLQTSVGTTPLRIVIDEGPGTKSISDQDLNDLAGKASLETYPGGVRQQVKVQVMRAALTDGQIAAIVLQPTAALTHQWYAMRLSSPPTGLVDVKFANVTGMHRDANGDLVSRFHPGAQPVVQYMGFTGSPPNYAGIKFSENVDFTVAGTSLFEFEQGGKTISYTASGPQVSAPAQDIVFAAPLSLTQPLTIVIKPGIVSSALSKEPLGAPGGKPLAPITIVIDQLPKPASYYWQTPL